MGDYDDAGWFVQKSLPSIAPAVWWWLHQHQHRANSLMPFVNLDWVYLKAENPPLSTYQQHFLQKIVREVLIKLLPHSKLFLFWLRRRVRNSSLQTSSNSHKSMTNCQFVSSKKCENYLWIFWEFCHLHQYLMLQKRFLQFSRISTQRWWQLRWASNFCCCKT